MMTQEDIVCFSVLLDIKIKSLFQLLRKIMLLLSISLCFMVAIFFLKGSFNDENSTSARILLWGAIDALPKKKQTVISLNKVTPVDAGPH